MAGVHQTIDLDDADLREALARLDGALRDMTEPMDAIGAALVASTPLRFEDQAGPDGEPWAPWSEEYARRRRRKDPDARLLQLFGHLRSSLTHDPGRDSVTYGSNLVYAAVQQLGDAHIPARPYLGIDDDDREMIAETLKAWIAEVLQ